jgi:hypothetical protein
MKMNNFIGVGLLIYCVSTLAYSYNIDGFSPNVKFILQAAISGFGGLSLLIYHNLDSLRRLFSTPWNINKKGRKEASRLRDFQALSYLRERIKGAGSAKGLEILIELNSIMFVADLGEDDE